MPRRCRRSWRGIGGSFWPCSSRPGSSIFCCTTSFSTAAPGSIGRGWWGDDLAERDEWGSRLWELARSKETAETLRRAEDAANDALSWMLADGLARSISVMAYSPAREVLGLVIKIDNVKQTLEIRHAV